MAVGMRQKAFCWRKLHCSRQSRGYYSGRSCDFLSKCHRFLNGNCFPLYRNGSTLLHVPVPHYGDNRTATSQAAFAAFCQYATTFQVVGTWPKMTKHALARFICFRNIVVFFFGPGGTLASSLGRSKVPPRVTLPTNPAPQRGARSACKTTTETHKKNALNSSSAEGNRIVATGAASARRSQTARNLLDSSHSIFSRLGRGESTMPAADNSSAPTGAEPRTINNSTGSATLYPWLQPFATSGRTCLSPFGELWAETTHGLFLATLTFRQNSRLGFGERLRNPARIVANPMFWNPVGNHVISSFISISFPATRLKIQGLYRIVREFISTLFPRSFQADFCTPGVTGFVPVRFPFRFKGST